MNLPDGVRALAIEQLGVLTRAQLLDGGVTPGQLRVRLGREWRLLLRGVVMLGNGAPTTDQRLVAAQLFAGPGSWLAGPTAAALHGVPGCSTTGTVHVLVPAPRRARTHAWVSVRNTTLLDERTTVRGPLRLSSAARAAVDAAALAPTDDVAAEILVGAVQTRTVRLADLTHWAAVRGSAGSRRVWAGLARAASGAWSVPEFELLGLVAASAFLPTPWPNPELVDAGGQRLTTPDLWLDDVGLAVMVHSRRFHGAPDDWERTVERDGDLAATGIVVVGVTPRSIERRPGEVLARIEKAYRAATTRPRPSVTATPRMLGPGVSALGRVASW